MVNIKELDIVGEKPGPTCYHCSAVVGNKLYIMSGLTPNSQSHHSAMQDTSVYCLDFDDYSWTKLNPRGKAPSTRCLASCVVVRNKIYIFGGYQISPSGTHKCFNGLYSFDTTKNEWEHIQASGFSPEPRAGASMIYYKKKLYVYGGSQGRHIFFGDLYTFDLRGRTWKHIESATGFAKRRCCHSASLVGNRMYVFGGIVSNSEYKDQKITNDLFYLDMETMEWQEEKPRNAHSSSSHGKGSSLVPPPRCCHASLAACNNIMIACGGDLLNSYDVNWEDDYLHDMFIYNTESKVWKRVRQAEGLLPNCLGLSLQYDPLHHRLLSYGGKLKNGQILDSLISISFEHAAPEVKKPGFLDNLLTSIFSSKNTTVDDNELEQLFVRHGVISQMTQTPATPGDVSSPVDIMSRPEPIIPTGEATSAERESSRMRSSKGKQQLHVVNILRHHEPELARKDSQEKMVLEKPLETQQSEHHEPKEGMLLDFDDFNEPALVSPAPQTSFSPPTINIAPPPPISFPALSRRKQGHVGEK